MRKELKEVDGLFAKLGYIMGLIIVIVGMVCVTFGLFGLKLSLEVLLVGAVLVLIRTCVIEPKIYKEEYVFEDEDH